MFVVEPVRLRQGNAAAQDKGLAAVRRFRRGTARSAVSDRPDRDHLARFRPYDRCVSVVDIGRSRRDDDLPRLVLGNVRIPGHILLCERGRIPERSAPDRSEGKKAKSNGISFHCMHRQSTSLTLITTFAKQRHQNHPRSFHLTNQLRQKL